MDILDSKLLSKQAYIGSRTLRTEDKALLKGLGQFVDDIKLDNTLFSSVLRSPHAHARIIDINITLASQLPGVHAIYLHKDLPLSAQKRLPLNTPNAAITLVMTQEILASTEVCYVGEPVAFVVAESRYIAEDACSIIEVDYEILDATSDCIEALRETTPLTHTIAKNNLIAKLPLSYGDIDGAFSADAVIVQDIFSQNRGSAHPMETRGYLAEFHKATSQLTVGLPDRPLT